MSVSNPNGTRPALLVSLSSEALLFVTEGVIERVRTLPTVSAPWSSSCGIDAANCCAFACTEPCRGGSCPMEVFIGAWGMGAWPPMGMGEEGFAERLTLDNGGCGWTRKQCNLSRLNKWIVKRIGVEIVTHLRNRSETLQPICR